LIYGIDQIKAHTQDMTAMEVYYLLPENNVDGDSSEHDWSSFFNSDGSINKEFVDKIKNFISKNLENSSMSDKEASEIEKMKEKMENSSDPNASHAGHQAAGNIRPINRLGHNTLCWDKILFEFVETKKILDCWNRPNRKLGAIYPKAILPSYIQQEKEEIFIAIDASGSIDEEAFQLFVDVVINTPQRFKIKCITFDTVCYDWDVKKGEAPRGRGGTHFNIIEKYIQENLERYPKAIFVLTDGDNGDGPVVVDQPNRWCWLLYGACRRENIKNMKNLEIKKLLK
jgi:predicted metal-dependent peptidase